MALPTGKSLPHFLPHPLPTFVSRKLTDYPFTGRLILNSTNTGRKLHVLVSIIDTKDASICKAQRKGPSVCPRRRGGVWEGRSHVHLRLSVCLFIRGHSPRGVSSSLPGPGSWAPAALDKPPSPSWGRPGSRAGRCRKPPFAFLPEALTTEKPVSLAPRGRHVCLRLHSRVALGGTPRSGLSAPSPLSTTASGLFADGRTSSRDAISSSCGTFSGRGSCEALTVSLRPVGAGRKCRTGRIPSLRRERVEAGFWGDPAPERTLPTPSTQETNSDRLGNKGPTLAAHPPEGLGPAPPHSPGWGACGGGADLPGVGERPRLVLADPRLTEWPARPSNERGRT